jgi:hypothetical protein
MQICPENLECCLRCQEVGIILYSDFYAFYFVLFEIFETQEELHFPLWIQ